MTEYQTRLIEDMWTTIEAQQRMMANFKIKDPSLTQLYNVRQQAVQAVMFVSELIGSLNEEAK